ncbi:MAG: glycosyltransferase [Candidatus Kapabacteria bacterium]|nr:glycosyltransferase [Candidatus Kapabacteria bacterium]
MKIAYLSAFYPYRGGIAQFNAALYRALEKSHDIKAFTYSRQYPGFLFPGTTQFVTDNDSADKIPAQRILDSINPLTYCTASKKILAERPHLFISKYWMPFLAPSLGWVARSMKKHGVINISVLGNVTAHEPRTGDSQLTKFFLNQFDGFVAMANEVRDDLMELKPDAKYIYHHHPNYNHFGNKIDKQTARKKFGISPDKKVILFFGLIRKYKGLDILLEALKNSDDYYLLIAGEVYGDEIFYQEIIKRNNLTEKVQFHNRYIPDNEVNEFFSASDVCVLPYRTATQSGIVGVSYNFELPVISTDIGGLKEVIEPYNCGIVITKPEVHLLRAAIDKYFTENKLIDYQTNIRQSIKYFSWDNLAKEIENFYIELKEHNRK